jgi:hypothetical protein
MRFQIDLLETGREQAAGAREEKVFGRVRERRGRDIHLYTPKPQVPRLRPQPMGE